MTATTEQPLFSGQAGTDATWSWIEEVPAGLRVCSQSIGSGASDLFGDSDVETFLTIPTARLEDVRPALLADLPRARRGSTVAELIAKRWRNSSLVTTQLRMWLTEREIEYDFHVF